MPLFNVQSRKYSDTSSCAESSTTASSTTRQAAKLWAKVKDTASHLGTVFEGGWYDDKYKAFEQRRNVRDTWLSKRKEECINSKNSWVEYHGGGA